LFLTPQAPDSSTRTTLDSSLEQHSYSPSSLAQQALESGLPHFVPSDSLPQAPSIVALSVQHG